MSELKPLSLLMYCRSGFEADCAEEVACLWERGLGALHKAKAVNCRWVKDQGYVVAALPGGLSLDDLRASFDLSKLVFARQLIFLAGAIDGLPSDDRASPLVSCLQQQAELLPEGLYSQLLVEAADTNEGKKLQKFCKQFMVPLGNRLKREGFKRVFSRKDCPQLHVFFPSYGHAMVGVSFPPTASSHNMGIIRLKFPGAAPSRSTLKLEEAFFTFLSADERDECLGDGMIAVDLGASPGGWTYQLLRRGLKVTAVDNGRMDDSLYDLGELEHLREDAFKYAPPQPVDWLVCDMVEQPQKVAKLVSHWLTQGWCRYAVVNFKLPMKKRLPELELCLGLIARNTGLKLGSAIRAKHLYHDRDEVTVMIRTDDGGRIL